MQVISVLYDWRAFCASQGTRGRISWGIWCLAFSSSSRLCQRCAFCVTCNTQITTIGCFSPYIAISHCFAASVVVS